MSPSFHCLATVVPGVYSDKYHPDHFDQPTIAQAQYNAIIHFYPTTQNYIVKIVQLNPLPLKALQAPVKQLLFCEKCSDLFEALAMLKLACSLHNAKDL